MRKVIPLTSLPVEEDDVNSFPSDWHPIDILKGVECRQVSLDTFQLRSASHMLTLNREGFDYYRNGTTRGFQQFEEWMIKHEIVSVPRDDTT
jgi:hypothetical protein